MFLRDDDDGGGGAADPLVSDKEKYRHLGMHVNIFYRTFRNICENKSCMRCKSNDGHGLWHVDIFLA